MKGRAAVLVASVGLAIGGGCDSSDGDDPPPSVRVPHATGTRTIDCVGRVETRGDQVPTSADVAVGDVVFFNLESLAVQVPAGSRSGGSERWSALQLNVGAPAARTVTLTVPRADRGSVGLLFGKGSGLGRHRRVADTAARAVLHACASSEPRFSKGLTETVGPRTAFAGGLFVTGPRCVTLRVRVDGGRPQRRERSLAFPVAGGTCPG